IRKVFVGSSSLDDVWRWKFTKDGNFTVKSAYHAARSTLSPTADLPAHLRTYGDDNWKWLWSLSLTPTICFFLWRCLHEALATTKNLWARHCSPTTLCPICHNQEESISHCLFHCPYARST
ncbi:Putative ribonuclease H protein At1g65750, partial [Linum perenne]